MSAVIFQQQIIKQRLRKQNDNKKSDSLYFMDNLNNVDTLN